MLIDLDALFAFVERADEGLDDIAMLRLPYDIGDALPSAKQDTKTLHGRKVERKSLRWNIRWTHASEQSVSGVCNW